MRVDSRPWATWGEEPPVLSGPSWRYLREAVGAAGPGARPAAPPPERLPPPLEAQLRERFAEILGAGAVRVDPQARRARSGGQSYPDLQARRAGEVRRFPDAVLIPGERRQLTPLLQACAELDVAVVPFAGGTSVVGGLEPLRGGHRAVVSLDLSGLDRILEIDPTGLLAVVESGVPGTALEAALGRHGLTLGHFPQSFERARVGGYAATRSAGQASTGYGRFDDLVVGLRMATPAGELVLPAQPGSAAGPDLRRLVLGSEGAFGVITELHLRVHRAPEVRRRTGWALRSWEAGLAAVRELVQAGAPPDVLRLADPEETAVTGRVGGTGAAARAALAGYLRARAGRQACLLIVGVEGGRDDVRYRSRRAARLLRRAGAVPLGAPVGRGWERSRFSAPYLRDALLDGGVLAETLETAALWRDLPALHRSVRAALRGVLGERSLIGAHVSHAYPVGASLYFTVLAAEPPQGGAALWEQAKQAASGAIAAAGATITHHHGVGTAHAPWLAAEDGEVGVAMLRAVKAQLDPTGILNPGKLLPGGG